MEDYSIERSGIPNLDFTGELIGKNSGQIPVVMIYRTKGGKFVGQSAANHKFSNAQHFDKPGDLITWFKLQNGNSVSSEVEEAIEDAAQHDDSFKAAWNERVD